MENQDCVNLVNRIFVLTYVLLCFYQIRIEFIGNRASHHPNTVDALFSVVTDCFSDKYSQQCVAKDSMENLKWGADYSSHNYQHLNLFCNNVHAFIVDPPKKDFF